MRYLEVRKPRIEIIPMIDIMLFLLVFFVMIALKMIPSSGLVGHLPGSNRPESLPKTKFMIEIHEGGSLYLDRQPVSLEGLRTRLAQGATPSSVVTIAGSAKASMQQLADVMSVCRQSGVAQIGLATRNVE